MTTKRKPTRDAVDILDRRYYEGKPERPAALAEARANDAVARKIYELRKRYPLFWKYLETGKARGIDNGYLASRRVPWDAKLCSRVEVRPVRAFHIAETQVAISTARAGGVANCRSISFGGVFLGVEALLRLQIGKEVFANSFVLLIIAIPHPTCCTRRSSPNVAEHL